MNALVPVVGLAFQGIVLSWIRKLEKTCNCSKDWRRDFMKLIAILGVIMNVVILATGKPFIPSLGPVIIVLFLVSLVNIVAILTYIPALKKKACVCAIEDDWRDNFIFWWVALSVIFSFLAGSIATVKSLR